MCEATHTHNISTLLYSTLLYINYTHNTHAVATHITPRQTLCDSCKSIVGGNAKADFV